MSVLEPCVIRQISRPDAALSKALATFGVAPVHEASGQLGPMYHEMRVLVPGLRICATASEAGVDGVVR